MTSKNIDRLKDFMKKEGVYWFGTLFLFALAGFLNRIVFVILTAGFIGRMFIVFVKPSWKEKLEQSMKLRLFIIVLLFALFFIYVYIASESMSPYQYPRRIFNP